MKQKLIAVLLLTLIPFTDSFAQFKWPWQQEKKEEKPKPGSNRFVYNNCAREVKLQFLKQVYPESNNQFREKFVKDLSEKPTDETPGYVEGRKCELKKKLDNMGLDNLVKFIEQDFSNITKFMIQSNMTYANFKSADEMLEKCQRETEKSHLTLLDAAQAAYNPRPIPGYKVVQVIDKKDSGFKAYILEKLNLAPGEPPTRIISIAGTEDAKDGIADATMGLAQYIQNQAEISSIVNDFITQGGKIQFTGHSLGGGLAQAFAHKAMVDFKKNNRARDPIAMNQIDVVTWNAFGAKPLIEMRQKLDEDLIGTRFDDQMVHYRTEGDTVSRLGEYPMGQIRTMSTQGFKNEDFKGTKGYMGISLLPRFREDTKLNRVNAHNFPAIRRSIEEYGLQTSLPGKDPHSLIPAGTAAKIIASWSDFSRFENNTGESDLAFAP
jgi:hypothetical protein